VKSSAGVWENYFIFSLSRYCKMWWWKHCQ